MSFDTDLNACAAITERADPLRFRAAMAAPVAARRVLFPLYAFNVEVARAPWVTAEPMIAEMRLQWWRDVCEEISTGKEVRRHEVATPLAAAISAEDAALLDGLILARQWDIYRDGFVNEAALGDYVNQTSGTLTWVAARRLGQADETVVRDAAYASGMAGWLSAVPRLLAQGRQPLPDTSAPAIAGLAQQALDRLAQARAARGKVSAAAGRALYHVGAAVPVLRAALASPQAVLDGTLPDTLVGDRRKLIWRAFTGRW